MKVFKRIKEFFNPRSDRDRAFHYAIIALGYWRRSLEKYPTQDDFKIIIEETNISVTLEK